MPRHRVAPTARSANPPYRQCLNKTCHFLAHHLPCHRARAPCTSASRTHDSMSIPLRECQTHVTRSGMPHHSPDVSVASTLAKQWGVPNHHIQYNNDKLLAMLPSQCPHVGDGLLTHCCHAPPLPAVRAQGELLRNDGSPDAEVVAEKVCSIFYRKIKYFTNFRKIVKIVKKILKSFIM